jgi:hypothetical protein
MTDRRAEEMPLRVRHLQEPARPTARIAPCPFLGQVANDRYRLGAGGADRSGSSIPSSSGTSRLPKARWKK